MRELIRDVLNGINDTRGRSAWESGVQHYAVDLLSESIDRRGLNIWDEAERIGKITEKDLLNGAKDWKQYSRDGNSLIYNEDICHRLCGWGNWERLQDGKLPPSSQEDWLDLQARALQQAVQIVIKANRRRKGENYGN